MSNGTGEKFCLRWNDFEKNISSAFRELRDDKDFFDVTLACDNNQIRAHKVILSACSPFFRSVLKKNPHDHPLLYLKGVCYEDITAVLNFMYHGEVNVSQDQLNSFLAVAEDLKVKGLTQDLGQKSDLRENRKVRNTLTEDPLQSNTRPNKQQRARQSYENNVKAQETLDNHRETLPHIKTEEPIVEEIATEDPEQMVVSNEYHDDSSTYEEYNHNFNEDPVQYEPGVFNTPQNRGFGTGWSKTSKPFPCQYCDKSFSNRDSLGKHTKSHTGQTYCDICDKNLSTVPNLRAHINTVHNKL